MARERRIARAALRIVLVLLLCGGAALAKRTLLPSDRDPGLRLFLPSGDAVAVAMDPAGTRLALVDGDGGVRVVGIADGREWRRLPSWEASREVAGAPSLSTGHDLVAFSPDGRHLAQGGSRGLRLWSLEDGASLPLRGVPASPTGALAFLPDGRLQARASAGGIYRWTIPDGLATVYPAAPLAADEAWAFGGGGRWALSCRPGPGARAAEPLASRDIPDMIVTVEEVGGGEAGRVVIPRGGSCAELVLSPDETTIAAMSIGKTYYLLDWRAGRARQPFRLDGGAGGGGIGFTPDGARVLLGGDGTIAELHVRTGWRLGTLRAAAPFTSPPVGFGDIQVSADGRLAVAACGDIAVRVWRR